MTEKQKAFETLPAEYKAQALSTETSMFFNIAKFEHAQRLATMFYQAQMWPAHLKTVGDALIILNLAERLGTDPVMLAQTVYIVHGKPGLEGKLVKALIDNSGKYKVPLRFKWVDGEDKDIPKAQVVNNHADDHRGCVAHTIGADGKALEGPKVDWHTVHSEGWYNKKGSKWPNMSELMFIYRASSWFANTNCPEVKLGMHTTEELKDINTVDLVQNGAGSFAPEPTTEDLAAKIMNTEVVPGGDTPVFAANLGNIMESSIVKVGPENLGDLTPKPTITPEKFPAVDAPLPPDTKIVESKLPDAPEKLWYDTSLWIKTKTTGFTAFCIDNADKFDGIPEGAVCVYKGRSMRVIDAMREKWYGVNEGQHFPGDPDPEPEIKTEVVYDPRDDAPPAAEEPAPDNGESVALNPAYHRQMNLRLKSDFPLEWDQARADLGFGMLAASEEAAERWNAKVSVMLDAQDNGK